MPGTVNKITLIGRLGRDPELRHTANSTSVANFSLATERFKKEGEEKPTVDWHRITVWGKQAEVAAQYLNKGSLVYVEGEMHYRKYTDKDNIERYSSDVQVRPGGLTFLSSRSNGNSNGSTDAAPADESSFEEPPF